jgi:hypothetical protein
MKSIIHLHKLLTVIGLLLIAVSCTQASSTDSDRSAISKDYQPYSKDGLSIKHPKHWSLIYDDNDSLLADRDVSFETPEFSKISVLIFDKSNVDTSEVADIFERTSKLKFSKNVEDYQRTSIEISGFKGYRLTWKNTLLGISTFELTVLKTGISTKPVFAVYILLDEDIEKESSNIIPFLTRISLQ